MSFSGPLPALCQKLLVQSNGHPSTIKEPNHDVYLSILHKGENRSIIGDRKACLFQTIDRTKSLYDLVTLFHRCRQAWLYTDCETVPCVVSYCIKYENKSDVVLRPAEDF